MVQDSSHHLEQKLFNPSPLEDSLTITHFLLLSSFFLKEKKKKKLFVLFSVFLECFIFYTC